MKRALVTGCCGQDGSILCNQLIGKGYSVVGVTRPSGNDRLRHLHAIYTNEKSQMRFCLHYGDITDPHLIVRLAQEQFDEVYLLAGQTQVGQSFLDPTYTMRVNAESPIAFMDAFKAYAPRTRIYFAGTSEMFGCVPKGTQADETHPFESHSPYAVAKTAAFLAARMYRRLGLFVVGGIGFNHESRFRGENFVTRKLGLGIRRFKETGQLVYVGNGDAIRDWHHASDTMEAAWLSLQAYAPDEFVFASGVPRTVRQLAQDLCDLHDVRFKDAVVFDPHVECRPWEVDYLCGNPHQAEMVLGWERRKTYEDLLLDVSAE